MSLTQQIQCFIGSLLLAALTSFIYSVINEFIKNIKPKILILLIETPYFLFASYLYNRFLLYIADGILNIFYLLAIILGIYIYYKFYFPYVNTWLINIKKIIKRTIINPIYLKITRIKYILKLRKDQRRKKGEKKKNKSKNT